MKLSSLTVLALAGWAALSCAPHAHADSLYAGNVAQSINITVVTGALPVIPESGNGLAGDFVGSTLNGLPLNWVYCVDLSRNININSGTYPTTVTDDGKIHTVPVNNAGEVAYLLDHFGTAAITPDETAALQAAIWKTIYGSQFTLNGPGVGTTSAVITDYNNYLAAGAGNADPVANLAWLSPHLNSGEPVQGLVTAAATPEPGTLALLVGMGVTGAGFLARRRKAAK